TPSERRLHRWSPLSSIDRPWCGVCATRLTAVGRPAIGRSAALRRGGGGGSGGGPTGRMAGARGGGGGGGRGGGGGGGGVGEEWRAERRRLVVKVGEGWLHVGDDGSRLGGSRGHGCVGDRRSSWFVRWGCRSGGQGAGRAVPFRVAQAKKGVRTWDASLS